MSNNPQTQTLTNNILPALLASILLASSLVIPAIALYCYNSGEFTFGLRDLLTRSALTWLALILLFFLPLFFLRSRRLFSWICAGILALSISIWIQQGILADAFAEYQIEQMGFNWLTILIWLLNFAVFGLPFVLCWRYRHWCHKHYSKLVIIVLLPQILPLAYRLMNYTQPKYDFYDYSITEHDKSTFGRQNNVLVIVVDCLGEYLFKQIWREYPEMRAPLRDFTCFDQMRSPKPSTRLAVPAILTSHEYTGPLPDVNENLHAEYLQRACHSAESLFVNFNREGYRCEGYPFILQTISYSPDLLANVSNRVENSNSHKLYLDILFNRLIPYFLKPLLTKHFLSVTDPFLTPRDETPINQPSLPQDLLFYQQLNSKSKVGDFDHSFKYLHFQGGHTAIVLNEKLEVSNNTDVKKQMRASFKVLELLLQKLQHFGLYEKSLIVITGDHSERYTPEIVTLIKRPGDKNTATIFNSLPCTITDIAPTVLAEMSLLPKERSLFSRQAITGSGDIALSEKPEVLEIGNWQLCQDEQDMTHALDSMFTQPYEVDNLNIILKHDLDLQKNTVKVNLFAEELQSRRLWQTESKQVGGQFGQPYSYQVSLKSLPAGNYLLFLSENTSSLPVNQDDDDGFLAELFTKPASETTSTIRYLPQFLLRQQEGASFSQDYPGLQQRTLSKGEAIRFNAMQPYPALQLPEDARLSGKGLRMSEQSILRVFLAPSDQALRLHLDLSFPISYPAIFEIFHDDTLLFRKNHAPQTTQQQQLTLPLPVEIINSGTLNLQFRLRKKYQNRTQTILPKFHLAGLSIE